LIGLQVHAVATINGYEYIRVSANRFRFSTNQQPTMKKLLLMQEQSNNE